MGHTSCEPGQATRIQARTSIASAKRAGEVLAQIILAAPFRSASATSSMSSP